MTVLSHKVLGSEFQTEIASTLTKVPGMQGFDVDPGENVFYEKGDVTSDYEEIDSSGVQAGGVTSGKMIWDPLDPVHQFHHAAFNNGGKFDDGSPNGVPLTGNIVVSNTGLQYPVSYLVKKWKIQFEKKSGLMVEYEFTHTDRLVLNETDPV